MSHTWIVRFAWVRPSDGEKVVRYEVRYRLGGRGKSHYGGRFKSKGEARRRCQWIDGELAAMRVPNVRALAEATPERTLARWSDAWADSRIDVRPATAANYRKHFKRWGRLAGMRVSQITPADVQEWIAAQSDLKPSSLKRYLTTLRQVLEFAGVEPNPARDKSLRRPRVVQTEVEPPTAAEVEAILAHIPPRWRLAVRVLEASGMRVGEMCDLEWRDVDVSGSRFRIRTGKTKAARRWVQVPPELMTEVAASCPPDDRVPERRVFGGMTGQDLRQAMGRACVAAGIPRYSPHDLRHRRASIWHREGVPFREIAARVGHTRTSLTADTYTHVILGEEDR